MDITTYKGFHKDLTCRGFQYKIGETYKHDGLVVRCTDQGFHSCENPLDVWGYYGPATSRYALTIASGDIDRSPGEDTKLASSEIYVDVELSVQEIARRAVSWIMREVRDSPVAYNGHGVANGSYGHGVANGEGGYGVANGEGGYGVANGEGGHGVANGEGGHGVANGPYGHGVANGFRGHGVANGKGGHGVANGCRGHGVANGYGGHGVANGPHGHGVANGSYGHGVANGFRGHGVANGHGGHGVANGSHGHGVANGSHGHGVANGEGGHAEVKGKSGIAAALGRYGTARATTGSAIVLAGYDLDGKLVVVRSTMVGENGVEPGKTYTLAVIDNEWVFKEVTE